MDALGLCLPKTAWPPTCYDLRAEDGHVAPPGAPETATRGDEALQAGADLGEGFGFAHALRDDDFNLYDRAHA